MATNFSSAFDISDLPALPPRNLFNTNQFAYRGVPTSYGRPFLQRPRLSTYNLEEENQICCTNMQNWFNEKYPDEDFIVDNLALLRQLSGSIPIGESSVDWSNMYISDLKDWHYENDIEKYLKRIVKFALMWHLEEDVTDRNKMPYKYYCNYARLFKKIQMAMNDI